MSHPVDILLVRLTRERSHGTTTEIILSPSSVQVRHASQSGTMLMILIDVRRRQKPETCHDVVVNKK